MNQVIHLYKTKTPTGGNYCISALKQKRSKADTLFEELMQKASQIYEENTLAIESSETALKSGKRKGKVKHFRASS